MAIDLDKLDSFFQQCQFFSKDFVEKFMSESQEVKKQFLSSFASHMGLVTLQEFSVYIKKLDELEKKVELLEQKIIDKQNS